MTNKQRLEEIENNFTTHLPHYSYSDHKWLIERVKKLTKALKEINNHVLDFHVQTIIGEVLEESE